jgi:hypothetical protein
MGVFKSADTLYGRDFFALGFNYRILTGKNHFTLYQYSTGTAVACRATLFGTGKL